MALDVSFVIQSQDLPLVKEKLPEICRVFKVEIDIPVDPLAPPGGSNWVFVRGKNILDAEDAKTHIIALCNPELREHVSFAGFPIFIFTAFKEQMKHILEREFGIVLFLTEGDFIDINGHDLGVASAISKIHHLHKLNKETSSQPSKEAEYFDRHVKEHADCYKTELLSLSDPLKKELFHILEITPQVDSDVPSASNSIGNTAHSKPIKVDDNGIIVLDSSSEEERLLQLNDVINLCESDGNSNKSSSDYEYESDDENNNTRIESDAASNFVLPPNFAIKEWIKIHYEGTSDPNDFVNKADMLNHFRNHFDLPDHPNLANTFFDRLAVRIFPTDANYRSVKTKKTKSKHSKRRLVCLRRKKVNGDLSYALPSSSQTAPMTMPSSQTAPTTMPSSSKPVTATSSTTSSPSMMQWHIDRVAAQSPPRVNPTSRINPPSRHTNPTPAQPYQIIQHPPRPRQPGPMPNQSVGQWLNTASRPPHPAPARRQGKNNGMESLARRIAGMTNNELIKRPRPRVNPNLRPVVIDGSNVAMSHGNKNKYSCRGIAICARFFIERGHKDVTCFVPNFRKGGGGIPPCSDTHLLIELEDLGIVKSTPSRRINGQNIVCYDDRFVVELAEITNGVIVSNDQYRDLMASEPRWRPVIEKQLLQFTMVGDIFMLPGDPLGRNGPDLDEFLQLPKNGRKPISPVRTIPGMTSPMPRPQPAPRQRQQTPVMTCWTPRPVIQSNPLPQPLLSPDHHTLEYEMLQLFPQRRMDIRRVIEEHPQIHDISHLIDVFLRIDTGQ